MSMGKVKGYNGETNFDYFFKQRQLFLVVLIHYCAMCF